jgi:DNA-binding transcriptional LysR family regulator
LGIRLLNRTTRKISLTDEGAQLYQRCTRILAEVAEVECLASSLQRTPRGRLRLNTDVTLARVVAAVVSDYVLIYPEVSIELIMTDQISDLVEGQFDLAIHSGSVSDSSLVQRRLGKAQRVICASPIYLARCGAPRTPEDLAGHNCLNVNNCSRTDRWRFASGTKEHEIEAAGNLCSNSIEAVRAAALTGQGICLLPLLSVAGDLKTGRLLRLLPDYVVAEATIQAIFPGGRHLSARVRTFLDFVAKRLREVDVDRIDRGKTCAETSVAREPKGSATTPAKATSVCAGGAHSARGYLRKDHVSGRRRSLPACNMEGFLPGTLTLESIGGTASAFVPVFGRRQQ